MQAWRGEYAPGDARTTQGAMIETDDAPSGFRLGAGEVRVLTMPTPFVISGRLWFRTGCREDAPGVYPMEGGYLSSAALLCDTGHCHHNPATFTGSRGGVLCGVIGGAPPTTAVEFTFVRTGEDAALDYYDVSQVDGHNVGVLMVPFPAVPADGTAPSFLAERPAHAEEAFWCGAGVCSPSADIQDCPPELRVYGRGGGADAPFLACQSICKAVAGMASNFDATSGRWLPPPRQPGGQYADFTGPLMEMAPEGYATLRRLFRSRYRWDANATSPALRPAAGDPRAWLTAPGRWLLVEEEEAEAA